MKLYTILVVTILLFLSSQADADYTVCWKPPTQNTNNSELTDLAGYKLWAIPVVRTYGSPQLFSVIPTEVCPKGNRGPDDCHFQDPDTGLMCYHKYWPSPEGDWKLKMQAYNTVGISSANSTEIFFELKDLNGDGNPDVVGGRDPGPVVVPQPEPDPVPQPEPTPEPIPQPDPVIDPAPVVVPQIGTMDITRKGFFTITDPTGNLLIKPDGNTRQVTSVLKAVEWITKDGRAGIFIINPPTYEVEWR